MRESFLLIIAISNQGWNTHIKLRLKRWVQSKARLRSQDLGHLQDTTKEAASGSSVMYIVDCTVPMLYAECLSQTTEYPSCMQSACYRVLVYNARKVPVAECPCCRVPKLNAEYLLQSAMLHAEFLLQCAHAAECPSCMQSACCTVPMLPKEWLKESTPARCRVSIQQAECCQNIA